LAPALGWPANPVFDVTGEGSASVIRPVAFIQDWSVPFARFLHPGEMRRPLRLVDASIKLGA
jgi:hypothetical protein